MHSVDKAALYEDTGSERSAQHSLWGSVTVSREAFELLRLKDRAMDNTKEGITIADCRQVHADERAVGGMELGQLPLQRPMPLARALL